MKNLEKLAEELFDGNKSAMVNFALNHTFGLDAKTGKRRSDAPKWAKSERIALVTD